MGFVSGLVMGAMLAEEESASQSKSGRTEKMNFITVRTYTGGMFDAKKDKIRTTPLERIMSLSESDYDGYFTLNLYPNSAWLLKGTQEEFLQEIKKLIKK